MTSLLGEWKLGGLVTFEMRKRRVVQLPNHPGELAIPYTVGCSGPGYAGIKCKTSFKGFLTQGAGGGAFYDAEGNLKADLRNQIYQCDKCREARRVRNETRRRGNRS
jgi:hypothetical protein